MDVRTDRLGKFRFQGLSPQQYHLTIRHPGYRDIEREIDLVFTGQEYLQLSLVPDHTEVGNRPPPAPVRAVIDANVPPEARKEFEKADAILVTQKKEKIGDAIIHLQKALTIDPNFLEAQLKLGAVYMDLQQWDNAEQASEAEKALRDGLLIEDRSWQGHFALGRFYYDRGELSKAARQVGLAIQLNGSFPDAHLLAANIHLKVNNRQDALEQFEEYLRLAPKGEFAAQARQAIQKLKQ